MKKLAYAIAFTITGLFLLLALVIVFALETGRMSRSDLDFLVDLGQRDGIGAVVQIIRTELYGVDESIAADPSYGRVQVPGRGHAPWVIRTNLDGRPRMLLFALAPDLWAAWDVAGQSLYQVWRGEVLFEGAAYNHQHGPQPVSRGDWYVRDTAGARWFILAAGEELPASVEYLGHEYGPDRATARMRFRLRAGEHRLQMTEQPEVEEREGGRYLTRTFTRDDDALTAGFYSSDGTRHLARGSLAFPLADARPIDTGSADPSARGQEAKGDDIERGEAVIADSGCLACHAETHRVTGPAWSQISGKFRGKLQAQVVDALTRSVLEGSIGTWGQVPMPAHPRLSETQARQAVTYILNVGEPTEIPDPPLDPAGEPYTATRRHDTLPRLDAVHPSFRLENIAPEGFEPKVGGMDFRADGKLVLASWDIDGAVYLVDPNAPSEKRVQRIAEGLQEPLGLTVVEDRLFVMQKQELTELIDLDGDEVIDRYAVVADDWRANPNFHSFAFGLVHRDDGFFFLLSICVLPGGASCPDQLPPQGKLLRAGRDGQIEVWASGFRTPNGITAAPDGSLYVTDNQGDWLPASKLVRVERGAFYGSRAVPDPDVMAREETPPVVWLPQDEVGNSPTEPLRLVEGPYAGQWIHGDVYNGGIKLVFTEKVAGREQGAAFHFSAGFQGGVNRLERGPDGHIYVGEVGNPPNWGEYGKSWYGLERLSWVGDNAFEIRAVRALEDGFELELTRPLAPDIEPRPADLLVKHWFYRPDEQYGGPKYDETAADVQRLTLSADRRRLRARIPGLRAGRVVYLRLDERLRAAGGQRLWTAEAWYTLNRIPVGEPPAAAVSHSGTEAGQWRNLFDGDTFDGWRNYGGDAGDVRKWRVEDGALTLEQKGLFPMWDLIRSTLFGGGSADLIYYREKFRDFELSLEWKIAEGGNSGIFYFVADEKEKMPWLTGLEMQVLDNDGHADGAFATRRAGALYDLVAPDPETARPPGQWNRALIRVRDNHIEHWLNGVKVLEVTRGSERWNRLVADSKFADMPRFGTVEAGHIVLQDHGDPVWYRNIRERTLP